ncbi:DUF5071 domain-containing protein [Pararhizobium arenae]|uniref:DUF5071 domain-containing protein n=1 Tax=Pararhizobium arenae TaxID=1856850 RepID=UPI00094B42EC|nr:DUF5071 domain-containing protein [Pararhizobium arenae]
MSELDSLNGDKMRLPVNKYDLDAVEKLGAADFPAITPLLDGLAAWIADGNWPVAKPIADLFVATGAAAIPALRRVLQGNDAIHQRFALLLVIDRLPPATAGLLRSDLEQMVRSPTLDQVREDVAELAERILRKLRV